MDSAKASVVDYPNPDVKLCVIMAVPYDLKLTLTKMGTFEKIGFKFARLHLEGSEEEYKTHSGMKYFRSKEITLTNHSEPTSNSARVFLAASLDDTTVDVENTRQAINKLQLSQNIYRFFQKGNHNFQGDEWLLAFVIYRFIFHNL
jgi:hypothetical protein